jgi:carbonic anhydrase
MASVRPAHWGYGEEDGPDKWASLSPAYSECGQGHSQSPIDIVSPSRDGHPKWGTEYGTTSLQIAHNQHVENIIDNGHTIQVNYAHGSQLAIEDHIYDLKQFHFHTPSENTVDGKHFPMEMHMVHQAADGALAVYAAFFEPGDHNESFDALVEHLPDQPGHAHDLADVTIDINKLLPQTRNAYHFSGSLTTPPCSEQVNWLVAVEPVPMAADQIEEFARRLGANNRPTQPLHGRSITVDDLPE